MGLFTQKCPGCGRTISRRARHCGGCGRPTETATLLCTDCGATVGATSEYCWKCGSPQQTVVRQQVVRGRWRRADGQVALRLEFGAPRFNRFPVVEVGEEMVGVLQWGDGSPAQLLPSGRHVIDGFWCRTLGLARARPRSAVLCDIGGIDVVSVVRGLSWKGRDELGVRLKARVWVDDAARFVREVVRGRGSLAVAELGDALACMARPELEADFAVCSRDDWADRARLSALTGRCEARLKPVCAAVGLGLGALERLEIVDATLDRLRVIEGELDRLAAEGEPNRRLRSALREAKVAERRDALALEAELARVDGEDRLDALEREETLRRKAALADHRIAMEQIQLQAEARQAEDSAEAERERLRREAEARADLATARAGLEAWEQVETTKRMIRAQREAQRAEFEKERMALRGTANVWALLSTLEGEQADRVLRLRELELKNVGSTEGVASGPGDTPPCGEAAPLR